MGDIADVTKLAGFEFTEHVVYSDEGNIIALRGLNIKNGQLILDDVKYIDGSNFSKLSRSKLFINDIMFTYVGTVGEVAIIKENDRFYLAPNVSRIRVKSDDSPKFISHYMRTDNFKNKVIFPLIATSSQPALSMENIRKFTINIPINREEQDCLAKYFDSLDHLITLHQRKCDEIKSLKKYMLQKMFPQNEQKVPEIRFKGFTEAWEQRKFSDIVARESSVCTSESDIPSVEYEDVIAEEGRLNKDIRSKEAIKSGIIFDGSQVLYGKLRPYLHNWLNPDFKGVAVGDWWVLKPIVMDKNFLYRLIQTQQFDNIANQSSGSKMPRADWNLISNSKFMVPLSKEEQSKIGRYFDSLDTLITLHQRKSISHPNHPTIHTKHKGEEKYVRIRVNDRGKINRTANLRRFPVDIPGGFKDGGGSVGEFQIYSGAE